MPFELVRSDTRIDFIGKRRITAVLSGGVLLISLVAALVQGVKLGIDFAGGTEIQARFAADVSVDEGDLRQVVDEVPGVEGLSVVRYGQPEANEYLLKFQAQALRLAGDGTAPEEGGGAGAAEGEGDMDRDVVVRISETLARAFGEHSFERVEFVGPRVGEELRDDGLMSLLLASLAILAYVTFRFSSRFAPGAIVAALHDLLITAGILVVLGMEFDLRILAAMLAILGYSLNDTIIIYDRIRENLELRTKVDLPEVLNQSVNQTLSRTILTSGSTLVALLSLFFLGGEVIRPFAFTMIVGVLVGTYSSVFIAAPTLLLLEERSAKKG